ncbi:MAG: FAD-dependent oxidoreductase [Polyangiales bacterium]
MRVAVVGAGPAALAAAYTLSVSGAEVHVYEAAPQVGGLTRSFSLWNETVDLGPHIFSGYTPRALALWQDIVGSKHRWLPRDTRIAIGDHSYRYPLQPAELLRTLGARGTTRALLSLGAAQLQRTDPNPSAEQFFVARFGRYLYELFFRPYCEKLWGLDPREVDVAFCEALVGDITILGTLWNKLRGQLSRREATLSPVFPYAHEGAGAFCERAAALVRLRGGRVELNQPVTRLAYERLRVTGLVVGERRTHYDWVIASMPLPQLVRALDIVDESVHHALRRLRFRSTILVYLRVKGRGVLPHLWIYANDRVLAGRVTNFAIWQGRPNALEQTLALEYSCTEGDALWQSEDEALAQLATRELSALANTTHEVVDAHVRRVRNTHPLYYRGYKHDLDQVTRQVERFGRLTVLGRAGSYDYDSQASAIERGIEVAGRVDALGTSLAVARDIHP